MIVTPGWLGRLSGGFGWTLNVRGTGDRSPQEGEGAARCQSRARKWCSLRLPAGPCGQDVRVSGKRFCARPGSLVCSTLGRWRPAAGGSRGLPPSQTLRKRGEWPDEAEVEEPGLLQVCSALAACWPPRPLPPGDGRCPAAPRCLRRAPCAPRRLRRAPCGPLWVPEAASLRGVWRGWCSFGACTTLALKEPCDLRP